MVRARLNLLEKNKLRGPGLPWINIIGNYSCTHVLLYAKMLKETETEETIVFCDVFIIGSISIGGWGGGPPGPPPGLRLWGR